MALVGISALARVTGVTARTLRHYEELGLLDPVRTRSRERRFPPEQCKRASLIILLRRCDVALSDIRAIINDPIDHSRANRIREALEARVAALDDQLQTVRETLAAVDRPLDRHSIGRAA